MNINLLPWRELQTQQRNKCMLLTTISSLVLVLLTWGSWQLLSLISLQKETQLLGELQKNLQAIAPSYQQALDRKQQQAQQNIQLQFLNAEIKNYLAATHILSAISEKIPQQVYLTAITREATTLGIEGRARTHADIAAFLQQMEMILTSAKPVVSETKTHDSTETEINFHLNYDIHSLY